MRELVAIFPTSASGERLANGKGVGCFEAEPWMERVGEGGEAE